MFESTPPPPTFDALLVASPVPSPSLVIAGFITLTPSIHAKRSCAFCLRFRAEVVVMVAAVRGGSRGGGSGCERGDGTAEKLAARREEVSREGVGGLAVSEAERREDPGARWRGMTGGEETREKGMTGAGASEKVRYEMSGPPRRVMGMVIGAPAL